MLGSKSSSSPFIVSPALLTFHRSPSFFLSCKMKNFKNHQQKLIYKSSDELTSVMRCTSRCLRASSRSLSSRSFSATRARSSVSSCSLNANSNCTDTIHNINIMKLINHRVCEVQCLMVNT